MALNQIRQATKSKFAALIIILLAGSFVLWGPSDVLQGSANRAVATVGGSEISVSDFARQYTRIVKRFERENKTSLSTEEAKQQGVPRSIAIQMIQREAVLKKARSLGLAASDAELRNQIRMIEGFQGVGGVFNVDQYEDMLRTNYYGRIEFEQNFRQDIVTGQLLGAISHQAKLPQGMIKLILSHNLEQRIANYVLISPERAEDMAPPTDEQLQDYFGLYSNDYQLPELRDLTFIVMKPSDFFTQISVPEDDVKALYDNRLEHDFTTTEKRDLALLNFPTKELADAALLRIKAGESFAAVATANNIDPSSIELGAKAKIELLDPKVAEAAFALEGPGVTEVVNAELSYAIAQVKSISAGFVTSYEEARADLLNELMTREAEKLLFAQTEVVEEDTASGVPLEEIAERLKLNLVKVEKVAATGVDKSGKPIAAIPANSNLVAEAFRSVINFDSEVIEFGENNFFVVRVDAIHQPAVPPLEEIRDEVAQDWLNTELNNASQAKADGYHQKITSGELTMEQVADELDRAVFTSSPLTRFNPEADPQLNGLILQQIFLAKADEVVLAKAAQGNAYIIAQVKETLPADPNLLDMLVASYHAQLEQELAEELEQSYIGILLSDYEVVMNEKAMETAISSQAAIY